MGHEGRAYLAKYPKRKKAKENFQANKKSRGNGGNYNGRQTDSQQQIAAIITGVMQASINSATVVHSNTTPRMPQHGPHARGSNISNVTTTTTTNNLAPRKYDHLGNICKVQSGPRRNVLSARSEKVIITSDKVMATEIDNHADTHCSGQNFVPFSWTGTVCTVSPFFHV